MNAYSQHQFFVTFTTQFSDAEEVVEAAAIDAYGDDSELQNRAKSRPGSMPLSHTAASAHPSDRSAMPISTLRCFAANLRTKPSPTLGLAALVEKVL
jgi:hypothetical protein